MTTTDALLRVARATRSRDKAEQAWRAAIVRAASDGASLRSIGKAANVSHVRVLQLVREEQERAFTEWAAEDDDGPHGAWGDGSTA